MPLSPTAGKLLAHLVERIKAGGLRLDDPRGFPKFGEVHQALGLEKQGTTAGQSLDEQAMAELGAWVKGCGYPAITALVVDREGLMPRPSFFSLHGETSDHLAWWQNELDKVLAFDWTEAVARAGTESES